MSQNQEALWWAMHHSDDPLLETAIVTGYFDESGTDDLSPIAVVGGILLNKSGFNIFDDEWKGMLASHKVSAIHMNEFGQHGKLGHLNSEHRKALLFDAVMITNKYKLRSMAAKLTVSDYDLYFREMVDTKKDMGPYGMCFILCAVLNHKLAEAAKYQERIPFLMDAGNNHAHHVTQAHKTVLEYQKAKPLNMGGLSFDDDELIRPLQAADMVSWSARRKITGMFDDGFEPLLQLFDGNHAEEPFHAEYLREIAESLAIRIKDAVAQG